jgi:hypothetical protein
VLTEPGVSVLRALLYGQDFNRRSPHALLFQLSLELPNTTSKVVLLLVGVGQTSLDGVETFRPDTDLGSSVLEIEESVL